MQTAQDLYILIESLKEILDICWWKDVYNRSNFPCWGKEPEEGELDPYIEFAQDAQKCRQGLIVLLSLLAGDSLCGSGEGEGKDLENVKLALRSFFAPSTVAGGLSKLDMITLDLRTPKSIDPGSTPGNGIKTIGFILRAMIAWERLQKKLWPHENDTEVNPIEVLRPAAQLLYPFVDASTNSDGRSSASGIGADRGGSHSSQTVSKHDWGIAIQSFMDIVSLSLKDHQAVEEVGPIVKDIEGSLRSLCQTLATRDPTFWPPGSANRELLPLASVLNQHWVYLSQKKSELDAYEESTSARTAQAVLARAQTLFTLWYAETQEPWRDVARSYFSLLLSQQPSR